MAQKFIDSLKRNIEVSESGEKSDLLERLEKDTECIRASALLHDITHIPFAHALEDENNILQRHDKSLRINKILENLKQELEELDPESYRTFSFNTWEDFKKAIEKCKKLLNDVRKVLWTISLHEEVDELIELKQKELKGDTSYKIYNEIKGIIEEKYKQQGVEMLEDDRYYIADIIGNTISSDLLSYVLRDPVIAGTEEKPGGWYRLFDYIYIVQDDAGRKRVTIKLTKKGELRLDVISTIIRILNTRYEITELINYHHAKACADAMLGKVAQFCKISESDEGICKELYRSGDEGFLNFLERRIEEGNVIEVEGWDKKDIQDGARTLLQNLRKRRFHKRFHEIRKPTSPEGYDLSEKYKNPETRLKLEKSIIDEFNLSPGQIIIFCPERKSMKEARTLVTFEKMNIYGSLESITVPLNNPKCIEHLKREVGEATVSRIEVIGKQYLDLWKLYVFVDPLIIPVYGYEIKQKLEREFGSCKTFDLSYIEIMRAYQVAKKLSEKVKTYVPEARKTEVLKYIDADRERGKRIGKYENFVDCLEKKMDDLIKEALKAIGPQKKLEGYS
jgi:HD superfamily phosphohydrolase